MRKVLLDGVAVGDGCLPYVIAEIGVNHGGDMSEAKRLIDLAKEGGAHAAKFQSYKAETIASKNSPSYWDLTKEPTTNQFQLFKKYDRFGEAEYRELAAHCASVGITFLSTPFDTAAIDFLDPLMPFYKIASADLTNLPFLRRVASKGKPVVLSTGASTLSEIDLAIDELRRHGAESVVLLHCVLAYPTHYGDANLNMIDGLRHAYPDCVIGYSDHTLPDPDMEVLTAAWLKGAAVVEKHFTFDKTIVGNDHFHSMDMHDLRRFCERTAFLRSLMGETLRRPLEVERVPRLNARRSIVLTRDVRAGDVVTEAMIVSKRPGSGISPLHWDEVIGMRLREDLPEDHVLQWSNLDPNKGP
ncbi:N-acetylneuraminate synthase family protein [Magnetospirillum aberrantis]|uniref:Acetylneuraminic acid synthetase n=1 Tax=Magnetospirillum aberrantis SpK TaxID=908842 RepID=A0A7C9QVM6_9PROT|nr:N-acetylneuraminate synthase family protein [Magnetospirillum aberrantis]NFV81537.1 acetylneuraminic acid synthetase [Magnetospirillum aberrantis SpK]